MTISYFVSKENITRLASLMVGVVSKEVSYADIGHVRVCFEGIHSGKPTHFLFRDNTYSNRTHFVSKAYIRPMHFEFR